VEEGGDPVCVTVTSSLPPSFFCHEADAADCYISVNARFAVMAEDAAIPCRTTPQAVLDWQDDEETTHTCGVHITALNWAEGVCIPVKAVMDGIKDGDVTRVLTVTAQFWIGDSSLGDPFSSDMNVSFVFLKCSVGTINVVVCCMRTCIRLYIPVREIPFYLTMPFFIKICAI
jgi:hypothetical protein